MAGRITLELRTGKPGRDARRREESPLHVLLLGDFSGRGLREAPADAPPLAERPIHALDVDSLESGPGRMQAGIELSLAGAPTPLALSFASLDDFHPDRLYARVPVFQALRETRARLRDPSTFAEEAAGLRAGATAAPGATPAEAPGAPGAPASAGAPREGVDETLERLLGRPAAAARPEPRGPAGGLQDFVRAIVAPYVVRDASDERTRLLDAVDQAASEQMRALLHHPRFQTLEATWRASAWLASRLETGETLTLSLLDVTKDELARDLSAAGDDPARSDLHRRLVDRGVDRLGGEPWSLVVGLFSFGPDADDAMLLARLGAVSSRAGGPFLATADPSHLGVGCLADHADPATWSEPGGEGTETWQALRESAVAPWIGLALPRLLLRLPYGASTDPIDAFAFEELTAASGHEALLWGSPAVGCAWLLGRAFEQRGWKLEPGDVLEIDDLPTWVRGEGDGRRLVPCAEVLLSDRAAEELAARGYLALRSHASRNCVRLLRFQSVATPATQLSGPWG